MLLWPTLMLTVCSSSSSASVTFLLLNFISWGSILRCSVFMVSPSMPLLTVMVRSSPPIANKLSMFQAPQVIGRVCFPMMGIFFFSLSLYSMRLPLLVPTARMSPFLDHDIQVSSWALMLVSSLTTSCVLEIQMMQMLLRVGRIASFCPLLSHCRMAHGWSGSPEGVGAGSFPGLDLSRPFLAGMGSSAWCSSPGSITSL
mmetsp:Transcript_31370/g.88974  ORF Transcript_31370/g.88974 Transcript_31370/m.88974 type:complete len:200 (+) Transcript_31370:5288-5887(+)